MKIYKVNVDPSNPIEHKIKVPLGTPFGIQIIWDHDKYPTFPKDPSGFWYTGDTQEGVLVPFGYVGYSEKENKTIFGEKIGVKTYTDIYASHKQELSKVGNKIDFYYAPGEDYYETWMTSKIYNWAHISIEVIPADSKVDYDMTLSDGNWITVDSKGIKFNQGFGSIIGGNAYATVDERDGASLQGNDLPVSLRSQNTIVQDILGEEGWSIGTLSLVSGDNNMPNISATWIGGTEDEPETIEFSTPLSSISNLSATGGGGITGISAVGDSIVTDKGTIAYVDSNGKPDTGALSAKRLDIVADTQIVGTNVGLSGDQELVIGAGNGITFSTSALTICGKEICLTKFLADYGS